MFYVETCVILKAFAVISPATQGPNMNCGEPILIHDDHMMR